MLQKHDGSELPGTSAWGQESKSGCGLRSYFSLKIGSLLAALWVAVHPIERTLLGAETELVVNSRFRFPELDLLRFLAACAVMLFHYTFRGPQTHSWMASFPVLSQIFQYGYLGANVFFILSGFVILLTAYEKDAITFTIARVVSSRCRTLSSAR
jgi:hypothetical protein